jgi:hypothetical protein
MVTIAQRVAEIRRATETILDMVTPEFAARAVSNNAKRYTNLAAASIGYIISFFY